MLLVEKIIVCYEKYLTPDKIAAFLQLLSENESDVNKLSKNDEGSEEINCENNPSSGTDINKDLNVTLDNAEIHIVPDSTQWKMCINKRSSERRLKQNIHSQASAPTTNYKKSSMP